MMSLAEQSKAATKDKRSAILAGTLDLISERGFHDTPMSKIAKEAGVSAGIIYHYFANKDELIAELYKEIKRKLFRTVLTGYSDQGSFRERYLYLWKSFLRFYVHHPTEARFLEQFENSPYYSLNWQEQFAEETRPFFDLFTQGVKADVLKDLPMEIVSELSFGVAAALGKRHVHGAITLTDEMIDAAASATWDAIRW